MGMTAHDRVDAGNTAGHFQVHIHAVMRQHNDHLCTLGARFIDNVLHVFFLDAEAPVWNHVARIGDRRVREGLAHNRDRDAVDLLDHVRLEYLVAEIAGFYILCQEVQLALEVIVDDVTDPLGTQSEFPVAGHYINTQQFARIDHVLALCPQRCSGTLPCVTTVKQQRAWPACADLFYQRGQMGEAANLAVDTGGLFKIKVSKSMGFQGVGAHAEMFKQFFPNQMRRFAKTGTQADIHIGFAEVNGF